MSPKPKGTDHLKVKKPLSVEKAIKRLENFLTTRVGPSSEIKYLMGESEREAVQALVDTVKKNYTTFSQ